MNSQTAEALVKLYKTALRLLWISFALTAIGALETILENVLNPNYDGGYVFAWAGIANPLSPFAAGLIAVPGILWLYRSAKSLSALSAEEAKKKYQAMWAFQSLVGGIVTFGAILMIPGSLMVLQMRLPGLAIVFPIFAGAWIHLKARRINRNLNSPDEGAAETKVADNKKTDDESLESAYKPAKKPVSGGKTSGLVPLAISAVLAAINVFVEVTFYNNFHNNPEFDAAKNLIPYPDSMYLGLAQLVDLAVYATIGVVMFVVAIINRKEIFRTRLILISVFTAINLLLFPGTFSLWLAGVTGPSDSAAQGKQEGQDSIATINYLRGQPLPPGFEMIDEYYEGFPNTAWRTGVYNLDEANVEATCQSVIDYTTALGVDMYKAEANSDSQPFQGDDKPLNTCIATMDTYPKLAAQPIEVISQAFILYGPANFGAHSPIKFELRLMKYGSEWEKPNAWGYEFMIGTTYGEDMNGKPGGLSQGTIEVNQLLQDFGQARLVEPERDPYDPAFVQEVLDKFQYEIPVKIFETKPGVANRLDVTNSDGAHFCLSIDKWDEQEMGISDPGFGYALGFMENLQVLKGFGNAVEGACK